jgi:hypothetical protein
LTFDILSNDDADGDSKMIGSDLFDDTADGIGFDSPVAGRVASCADLLT